MNLDCVVQRHGLPWAPCPAASDVDVWQEYETPLIGTFGLGQSTILFTVIGTPAVNGGAVWAYVEIEPMAIPDDFANIEAMRDFVTDAFQDREAVLALVSDLQIERWSRMKVTNLYEAANAFLDQVIESIADPRVSFHARLVGVDNVAATIEPPENTARELELA